MDQINKGAIAMILGVLWATAGAIVAVFDNNFLSYCGCCTLWVLPTVFLIGTAFLLVATSHDPETV